LGVLKPEGGCFKGWGRPTGYYWFEGRVPGVFPLMDYFREKGREALLLET